MIGIIAGVALGAILLASGALKLIDRSWPEQARAMRAPRWSIHLVPIVEVVLGACLVVGVYRPLMATISALLIVAFTWLIAFNLLTGNNAPCACFGAKSVKPISYVTLIRNAILFGLAALAALT